MTKKTIRRKPGFRTYEVELMAVLDCVSPDAERLYRKLWQRVNLTKGDGRAWPSWQTIRKDCGGWGFGRLSKAIKELEYFRLMTVVRPDEDKALSEHAHNDYILTPMKKLPSAVELSSLLKQKRLATKSVATATKSGVASLPKQKSNKDEGNQYESNQDESIQDESPLTEQFFRKVVVKEPEEAIPDVTVTSLTLPEEPSVPATNPETVGPDGPPSTPVADRVPPPKNEPVINLVARFIAIQDGSLEERVAKTQRRFPHLPQSQIRYVAGQLWPEGV